MNKIVNFIKTHLLFIVFLLLVAVVVAIFLLLPKADLKKQQAQRLTIPKIEDQVGGTPKFTSKLSEEKIKIPSRLPIYEIRNTSFTKDQANQIASKLGFTTNPDTYNDIREGEILSWFDKGKMLDISLQIRKVSYTSDIILDANLPGLFPQDDVLIRTAKGFISENGLATSTDFELSNLQFFSSNSGDELQPVSKGQANYANVVLQQKIGEYPITNIFPVVGTIRVAIDKKGRILSADVETQEELFEVGQYPIKTFQELIDSLPSAKIQEIDNGQIRLYDISGTAIESIDVEEASIAYLREYDAKSKNLQPIFILKGNVVFKDSGKVKTTLFLPAIATYVNP